MPDNEVKFASGGSGSKQPRLELIPYIALIRAASRFELGIQGRPDGSSWNALSENFHKCIVDLPIVLSRAAHTAQHAMKLKAILAGEIPDDGDDHAGAILWGGCFLACATEALSKTPLAISCGACGGDGHEHVYTSSPNGPAIWVSTGDPCGACDGTGKI